MGRIRHPLLLALGLLALVLVAFGLFAPRPPPGQGEALQDLPWHVERDHEGNARVLGITLGRDRLALLAQRFGAPQGVGLFRSERGDSLEAYFPTIRTGRLEGRLVARLEAEPEQIEGYVARALAAERTASGATRFTLGADDKAALGARRVTAISYLPKYRGLDSSTCPPGTSCCPPTPRPNVDRGLNRRPASPSASETPRRAPPPACPAPGASRSASSPGAAAT